MREAWFPENVRVGLFKEWRGGEIWHEWFASRSRMLEYALELEQKISDAGLVNSHTHSVLVLCGEGFVWHQSQLEDFVSFYFRGLHRADDPFALAEQKYMVEQNLSFARTVSRFACMKRRQGEVRQSRLNWNVQPPRDMFYV